MALGAALRGGIWGDDRRLLEGAVRADEAGVMAIRFDGRVAIVTGAGGGLGRSHALGLASRGAKVVVNDLPPRDGGPSPADAVVEEIRAAGGEAISNPANVANPEEAAALVQTTLEHFGRVDILVNNAGILRDKTFAKMDLADFRAVVDVHLMGAANCCKAVWAPMRAQQYGRIVMTSSAAGLYGNFGQANYAAAKMALVGLMNTLHLEGHRDGIRVNTFAPIAATRMTEGLLPPDLKEQATAESASVGVLYLVSEDAPSRLILAAGGGNFAATRIYETEGIYLPASELTPETVAARIDEILAPERQAMPADASDQASKFFSRMGREMPDGAQLARPSVDGARQ